MNANEFREIVQRARAANPLWFELEADPPASAGEIGHLEASLGMKLPGDYSDFLLEYGGGYFAMAVLFSAREGSPFNLLQNNEEAGFLGKGFLAISDNGAGDYYGYRVIDGAAQPGIVFADHEQGYALGSTSFADVYEFLARKALQPR
jgi:hypothetical protein